MADATAPTLVEDLFRREFAHLVAALTRVLGPSNLSLAEDVVQEALLSAMHAWQFGLPRDPKAWILQTAKNKAIDVIRRDRRLTSLPEEFDSEDSALQPGEDAANQLAMMFSVCDDALSQETRVTMILRLLCGLSPTEIARAYFVDTQTIDRRLHRGRTRLKEIGRLRDFSAPEDMRTRLQSVLNALYLLFNEGYHGNDPQNPLHPAMCADALRLAELVLESRATAHVDAHALAALFCFNSARLATRLDAEGVFVPLTDQNRSLWDQSLIERGILHLAAASIGDRLTRWHLEAGIACEHTIARSVHDTNWSRIVALYDLLIELAPGPVVALNRGLAIAELRGLDAGREALEAVANDERLARYSFFWAALADIERRAGRATEARPLYERAIALASSTAERLGYERKLRLLEN